jgi:hypothetical protein
LIKKTLENILEKSAIYSSMHLHLLFPTVKIAALPCFYQNLFKNTNPPFLERAVVSELLPEISNGI